jgi:lactoylglutathione lyase
LDVSRKFYEQLGFRFIVGPVGPEPVAVVEHPCGVNINFILNGSVNAPASNVLMDQVEKYPGYTHVALEVSDLDSVAEKIVGMGLTITEEVEFEGARFFFIRDPDSNVIEFHQPAEPQ